MALDNKDYRKGSHIPDDSECDKWKGLGAFYRKFIKTSIEEKAQDCFKIS